MNSLIDQVPTGKEQSASMLRSTELYPGAVEPLSERHLSVTKQSESANERANLIVASLMSELLWGDDSPESRNVFIEDAYRMSRNLIDTELGERSPLALSIIENLRPFGNANLSFQVLNEVDRYGLVSPVQEQERGSTSEANFAVQVETFRPDGIQAKLLFSSYESKGGTKLGVHDIGFLMLMHVVGHEAGHIVQRSIGDGLLKNKPGLSLFRFPSELVENAKVGLTGDNIKDLQIHHERFAEGYGFIGTDRIAKMMGADDAEISLLHEVLGQHPIHEITGDHPLNVVGYSHPLSIEQLIADLEYLDAGANPEYSPTTTIEQAYHVREEQVA